MIEYYLEVAKEVDYNLETGDFFWTLPKKKRNLSKPIGTSNGKGYRRIVFKGKSLYLHRLAFVIVKGYLPHTVDHIDRDSGNNAWSNLREATPTENLFNRVVSNKTGYPRVSRHRERFVVKFTKNGEVLRWSFGTEEDAVEFEEFIRPIIQGGFAINA